MKFRKKRIVDTVECVVFNYRFYLLSVNSKGNDACKLPENIWDLRFLQL
jgi:hypothetical protein